MQSVVFEQFGDPAAVLECRDVPPPSPGAGQVRVRMLASPINPSDLLYVRGEYGRQPSLPASPGFEGAGIVEEAGPGLLGRLRVGRRVAVLNAAGGNWQEQVIVPARQVVPMANSIPDEQAAMFFVNPASAYLMTCSVLKVPPGAWLMQTAAGSALGRMVIRLSKQFGFRTINIVRRREQADELRKADGDAVICTGDESIESRVQEITNGEGAPFAIDAVGGETGSAVARSLGPNGRMLVYGTLSEEPMTLHPRTLMMGQKRIDGFWLSEWAKEHNALNMLKLFRRVSRLMAAGVLVSEVGAAYPLDQIKIAAAQAAKPGRDGKVLLKMPAKH
jgi:NADPH:quinone reductase-like Zn-dependent oxidoreductase